MAEEQIYHQLSLWDSIYPRKVIDKPIRLIEFFAGIGAQQKPLDNMKSNVFISPTITARGAGEDHSGMVLIDTDLFKDNEVIDIKSSEDFQREHSSEEVPTLITTEKFAVVEKDDENHGGGYQ